MRLAKIYKPTKTAMQSGRKNTKKWLLEYFSTETNVEPLMGWESSNDTMSQIRLEFETKEEAINYAKLNNIKFTLVNPKKRKIILKSYEDNFKN